MIDKAWLFIPLAYFVFFYAVHRPHLETKRQCAIRRQKERRKANIGKDQDNDETN